MNLRKAMTLVLAAGMAAVGSAAQADMILGYQEVGPNGPVTGSGTVNAFALGQSAFYGDTFSAPTTTITRSPSPGWGFYDDFIFSIPANASADSVTSTINLGSLSISNLEVRLYSLSGNTPPVLNTPVGGAIESWSSPLNGGPGITGTVNVLDADNLATGSYVLEVRGNVTGSTGGSYSGTLNVDPVPLPAALPLLLSGIGLLGAAARRRRDAA
jgi:hypothetical protein